MHLSCFMASFCKPNAIPNAYTRRGFEPQVCKVFLIIKSFGLFCLYFNIWTSVDLEKPDFSIHSRAESSMEYSQKVILHAGDALFIPEGWFKAMFTFSLIFKSPSPTPRTCIGQDQLLHGTSVGSENSRKLIFHDNHDGQTDHYEREFCNKNGLEDSKGIGQKNRKVLHQLEPNALQALHQLVCLVNDGINVVRQTQPEQTSSADSSLVDINGKPMKAAIEHLFCVKDDPVADILWFLEPLELQNVLLAMVHQFPRTLEALILHMLSPVGAEVLARKFDQMDGMFIKEDRDQFYQEFYGVFDDHYAAMDAILSRKESFALQVSLYSILELL
ncbi:hypothetical protein GIB67_027090 [Kingdonia uniflora]|uniref:Cupin-like domain-containing protein n=1 Tax=Kingdonia uniflora TaxID=39325 RepID=A0A7J7P1T2_9MAGN|nr:hypothetical protein GIB67_027090 [Kingdonia uniflora]